MGVKSEFVSEPIQPDRGTAAIGAMARGLAGLPTGFTWRDNHYAIREILGEWKRSEAYTHRPGGERYYRKHYYRVRVDTGEIMTLYAARHVKNGENPRRRWRLHTVERQTLPDQR